MAAIVAGDFEVEGVGAFAQVAHVDGRALFGAVARAPLPLADLVAVDVA